ncbi:transglycosylase SLT domain-containing protein [Brucellaceae bacterium C25G]
MRIARVSHYQIKHSEVNNSLRLGASVLMLGLVLTGCNTTGEGASSQTAALTSAVEQATATAQVSAETSKTEMAAATQVAAIQSAPLPVSRPADMTAMAYASSEAQASPGSLATSLAFETPANAPTGLDELIQKYATTYEVPERLVRRVVHRESKFNPSARNGPYWGLMQISHSTARGMGYRGQASGLLDADTNLKYAVKYLAGAYKVADGDESQAVRFYARGYYYDAKRKGLLEETGLRPARK